MELINEFRVGVSVPEAWKVLTDVERIAPLLPGAQLQEVEGDEYRGVVKVKVGPITAQYKGAATFLEQDEPGGRVVLKASGRDTRGQGNASAIITAVMTPEGDATKVTVTTDLTITGKVAQFGRGVLAEVSAKLMGQFVDALHEDLASSGASVAASSASSTAAAETTSASGPAGTGTAASSTTPSPAPSEVSPGTASAGSATGTTVSNGSGPSAAEAAGPRRIDAPDAQPVDLLAVAGGSTLKRLLPVALVALVLAPLGRRRSRPAN